MEAMSSLANQVDILLEVTRHLEYLQAFGSISALAVVDLDHQDILQPLLRSLKKKIVIDLADYRWVKKEQYRDIQ